MCRMTVETTLALEFFAVFSRFEYALKVTGFRQRRSREAKASWQKFADKIAVSFDENVLPNIRQPFDYITSNPPRVLSVLGDSLEWKVVLLGVGLSNARQVLALICRVRNNFFHGGKFVLDLAAPPERDRDLLTHAVAVLNECIRIDPDVYAKYCEQ